MTLPDETLPEGWASATLDVAFAINPAKPPVTLLPGDAPVSFVPMPAVDAESGAITQPQVKPFGEVRKGYTAFRDGDVLFAKITPCMENGKAAVARNLTNGVGFGSTEFHVLRPTGVALAEYGYRFIRQQSFRDEAARNMSGSAGQLRVSTDYFRAVEIPLPPLAEQTRIVEAVEACLARVDAARERLSHVPVLLKKFRQSVLASACSGRLTADWRDARNESPPWGIERADDLCAKVQSGSTPRAGFQSGEGIPFLKVYNIVNQKVDFEYKPQFVTAQQHKKELARSCALPGDVLMNIVGPPLGKVAIVPETYPEWNINQAITLFRSNERVTSRWLYIFLCSGISVAENDLLFGASPEVSYGGAVSSNKLNCPSYKG